MNANRRGAYTANDSLTDYILGITYEIWEEGGVELIDQYYGQQCVVYALDGIIRGAGAMIDGTNSMLAAFPDRLLLGDDVIGKGDCHKGYSSHRVLSPMTNSGDSAFGPATGRQVRIMNVADCAVEEGVIVEEWLARDSLALVRQLGFDVSGSAAKLRERQSDELRNWFAEESSRLTARAPEETGESVSGVDPQALLHAAWISGEESVFEANYPHYAVLHRSPVEILSGRDSILRHFAGLRSAFAIEGATVDHICRQPARKDVDHVAVRWSLCGEHCGEYLGLAATGKPVYVMGVTHRRIVSGRVAVEWTVFDSLAVLAQLI